MNEINAIGAVGEIGATNASASVDNILSLRANVPNALDNVPQVDGGFSSILAEGLAKVNAKVAHADRMVTRFAVDDSTPIHQVTIALEEARLSVEIAMQIRQRFVEGYRELMNMQI